MSTFKLLTQRRFAPFFGVQFLGALNDNLFKNSLVIMIAFKAASEAESGMLINLAAGLFILPFFLFSAVAGQIADKFEKSQIMRTVKAAEIGIMLIAAVGFYTGHTVLLFVTLFLMGIHSAFFGPAKYSILPQHLKENELMAGNALVEMGTFMAILIGTLAGGLLAGQQNATAISGAILGVAFVGYFTSRFVPLAPATAPGLKLSWNPFSEMVVLTKIIRKKEAVFNSIFGISWFWYFGATMLAQLPNFTKHMLQGNESVVTLLLAIFSISIGIGSVLSEKLSRGEIELGLVPVGAIGMTIFAGDLFFIDYPAGGDHLFNVMEFLTGPTATAVRVLVDLGMVGIFSSLFIVPLYALIQYRADADSRSRVIAANNIFNSVFMVASALITMVLFKIGFNTIEIFLFTAILNLVVSIYIFLLIPEFFMRFVTWILASTIYRLRYGSGRDVIPRQGGALIVCNHVSFIDWFIITAACRRPVRFVMDHNFFKMPVVGWLFRLAKAIPIAPAKEDAALKEKAFERIAFDLNDGNLVCIFPEGKITHDGNMNPFKPGVERILATTPVAVYPMAIGGLWGSFFSRQGGKAMSHVPKPSRRQISIAFGAAMPATSTAAAMEAQVKTLLGSTAAASGAANFASAAK